MSTAAVRWAIHDAAVHDPGAFATLVVMADVANEPNGWQVWFTRDEIGTLSRQSVATVTRHLRALRDAGLIRPVGRDEQCQRARRRRVNRSTVWALNVGATGSDRAVLSAHGEPVDGDASTYPLNTRPTATRRRRPEDDFIDVIVEVYGTTTRSGMAFYADKAREIMAMPDATPDELRKRALRCRQRYGPKSTIAAVAKHWPMLGDQTPRQSERSRRFDAWAEQPFADGGAQ